MAYKIQKHSGARNKDFPVGKENKTCAMRKGLETLSACGGEGPERLLEIPVRKLGSEINPSSLKTKWEIVQTAGSVPLTLWQ